MVWCFCILGILAKVRRLGLPCAGVGHGLPGGLGREAVAFLEEFDGDAVGGFDEGHVAVFWGAIDGDACVL